VIKKFENEHLFRKFPGFNPELSSISAAVSLRGVSVTLKSYISIDKVTKQVSRQLDFCLGGDCVHFTQAFFSKLASHIGAPGDNSREDVWSQLMNYLNGQGSTALLSQLAADWIKQTSIDPVAGNPNSFMGQLTKANFNLAANGLLQGNTSGLNLFALTPSYSSSTLSGITVKHAYLPIQYLHYFSQDNAMFIDAPISEDQVGSAKGYSAALGFGYMHVMTRQPKYIWSLTPSLFGGAVGSIDLGSGTGVIDGTLASRLLFPRGILTYGITNDLSFLKTIQVQIGKTKTPYKLNSLMMSNGADVTRKLSNDYSIGGYYTLTNNIAGLRWYVNNYSEIAFKLAKLSHYNNAIYDNMTLNVGYLFGANNYQSADVSLELRF
jgi:hypothetical protein